MTAITFLTIIICVLIIWNLVNSLYISSIDKENELARKDIISQAREKSIDLENKIERATVWRMSDYSSLMDKITPLNFRINKLEEYEIVKNKKRKK